MAKTVQVIKKDKGWFRVKRYPHIGLPLTPRDKGLVESYVKDKAKIESHSFFPFIHRVSKVRKFRREISHDGTRSKLRKPSHKIRELYYASHLDSNIYSYYAELLGKCYNEQLEARNISECVTAYRKVKLDPLELKGRNKCNIDFANDVFSYVKNHSAEHLVAITFDIKSFFDTLSHKRLKKKWREVIGSGLDLPPAHYSIFRNITKFSFVEERDIFNEFKNKILVQREPSLIKNQLIKHRKFLRNKRAVAFCIQKNIKSLRTKNFIKSNKYEKDENGNLNLRTKGIPQGSPISSVLANIYMLDFDEKVNKYFENKTGIYRRYSDDMVVVCEPKDETELIKFFIEEVKSYELEIQQSKTQFFHFIKNKKSKRFECKEKNLNTSKFNSNTKFEYLGFQFDGHYTLLKNSSLASYYRKMKRSVKRGLFYSKHNKTKTKGELFKNRLYKKFTHLGAQRKRKYERDKKEPSKFNLTHKFDWGNYLSYAKLAASTIPDNKIKGQIKRHWEIFHSLIKGGK